MMTLKTMLCSVSLTTLLLVFQRTLAFHVIEPRQQHARSAPTTSLKANVVSYAILSGQSHGDDAPAWTDDETPMPSQQVQQQHQVQQQREQQQREPAKQRNGRRLSRPQRKALERERKAKRAASSAAAAAKPPQNRNHQRPNSNHRKHNFGARQHQLVGRKPGEGKLELHSTVLPELNKDTSTAEDVIRAIKRAQNLHDCHDLKAISRFLLQHTDESFAYGYKGSLLSRLAVAALHIQGCHDLAQSAIEHRRVHYRASMRPMESAAVVRNLLRVHNVTEAWDILNDELSLPLPGTDVASSPNQSRLKHRASALASIASRHFFEGEPRAAVHACNKLASLGHILHEAELTGSQLSLPWARLVQGARQCQAQLRNGTISLDDHENNNKANGEQQAEATTEIWTSSNELHEIDATHVPSNVVYSVLNAMIALPSENDNRVYELLSNALVRRVVFVTGAVDMQGCPPADRGEAAFIGRSNVGKSSLINMITNRKSLAYISKRPGKTQQFNFFAVNDKPGREQEIRYGDAVAGERDADSFHMVDLPGFGYARVPEQQRREWAAFMKEYISTRPTLRVVFHLIDSRHGPTDEDELIMRQVHESLGSSSSSPKQQQQQQQAAKYVIVLTKADKNVKGATTKYSGRVSQQVVNKLERAMDNNLGDNCKNTVPVILTSAQSKLGRDEVWRYLSRAAAL